MAAFLDPVTASKIEIYSHVPTERLLELLPAESLPTEYGGKCTEEYRACVPWPDVLSEGYENHHGEGSAVVRD